jgi:hypothetical protein
MIIGLEHSSRSAASSCWQAMLGYLVILGICLLVGGPAWAQQADTGPASAAVNTATEEELAALLPSWLAQLPDARDLAASLADADSREDALLSLTALAWLMQTFPDAAPGQEQELVYYFRESRSWLDRLAARFQRLPVRSTVLDPAVQVLQQELWQHRLLPTPAVAALGPDYPDLLPLLFDSSDERIATSFLPEALFRVEHSAVLVWLDATTQAARQPALAQALAQLSADWFDPWTAAEPPAPSATSGSPTGLESHLLSTRVLLDSLTLSEPPDQLRLRRLLFDLHQALPQLDGAEARSAQQLLRLVLAVNGLHAGQYLEFSQSLLWIAADLVDGRAREQEVDTRLAALLAAFLPQLSTHMSRAFSEVDARINANLAAVFDVAQELQSSEPVTRRLEGLQRELGDAVAQLALLAPDLAFYFNQPVRQAIREEIDICISLMADRDDGGQLKLSRDQYDRCMATLLDIADRSLRSAELSGDRDGPFAVDQLARELELLPSQRINYLLGYLYDQAPSPCPAFSQPLPNPLDWSAMAATLTWFALQSPVFMQTPDNEARLRRMQQIGTDLMQVMSQQLDCLSGAAGGRSDPVSQVLAEYRTALEALAGGIREAELEFREVHLRPGADVVLGGNASQSTSYRTEGLAIIPCNAASICEMAQSLESTRALVGLFPEVYLLADQTGLGQVEICYDNMSWVERRAERVRADDPNVANYFGRLSFELRGRYREGQQLRDIFGARFTSPAEYNYLIAAAENEVLQDACPAERVGSRIVTRRTENEGLGIVPNRLTYLASARSRPSELLNANWSRGEEWRDLFITGQGVEPMEFADDNAVADRLGQHLRSLYQSEQQAIYSGMLRSGREAGDGDFRMLSVHLNRVSTFKALLRSELALFYPETLLDSDALRSLLEGQNGLLDEAIIRRSRANDVSMGEIHAAGLDRLDRFQALWKQQPESVVRSGSAPVGMAHALARLDFIDRLYFKSAARELTASDEPPAAPELAADAAGTNNQD